MRKRNLLFAAAVGLLVCLTVAWKQDAPTPEYRDVLRGLVGQDVSYDRTQGSAAVLLFHPAHNRHTETISAVGADFVEVTEQDGRKVYFPIGKVILFVRPDK